MTKRQEQEAIIAHHVRNNKHRVQALEAITVRWQRPFLSSIFIQWTHLVTQRRNLAAVSKQYTRTFLYSLKSCVV